MRAQENTMKLRYNGGAPERTCLKLTPPQVRYKVPRGKTTFDQPASAGGVLSLVIAGKLGSHRRE